MSTEIQKCSFMDPEKNMAECPKEAKWACRVNFGPFMLGWWGCDDHRAYFENLLPVISKTGGGYVAVPVMGLATRSPLILHMDYLRTGTMGTREPKFKCDICDRPIVRNYDKNRWEHGDKRIKHEARVG